MSHAGVAMALKERLSNVRAFVTATWTCCKDLLRWPVPAQGPHLIFGRASCAVKASPDHVTSETSSISLAMMGAIIEWVNKLRVQHPLLLTLSRRSSLVYLHSDATALVSSPTGAWFAQVVRDDVLVYDPTTDLPCRHHH
jgi:hypothetical protein